MGGTEKQALSWFEFVFDSTGNLLKTHLSDSSAEPSAAQLIIQFLERSKAPATNNAQTPETFLQGENKRSRRLKQLALQTAFHLKWNLEALEESLSLQWQDVLLSQLLKTVSFNNGEIDLGNPDRQSVMALVIYHRWVIRTLAQHFLPNIGKTKNGMLEAIGNESIFKNLRDQLSTSLMILEKALSLTEDLELPCPPEQHKTPENRSPAAPPSNHATAEATEGGQSTADERKPGEDGNEKDAPPECNGSVDEKMDVTNQNGTDAVAEKVSKDEIIAQVSYDLATLYFYQEKFEESAKLFQHCKEAKCNKSPFYSVNENELHGYYVACCGILGKPPTEIASAPVTTSTLLEQVEQCKTSGYKDLVHLLLEDNRRFTLPMDYRLSLVSDAEAASPDQPTTDDAVPLVWQIQACNTLRSILAGKGAEPAYWASLRNCTQEQLKCLFSLCVQSLADKVDDPGILARDPRFKAMKSFVHLVCGSLETIDGMAVLRDSQANIFMDPMPMPQEEKQDTPRSKSPEKVPFTFKCVERGQMHQGDSVDLLCGNLVHKLRMCYDPLDINAILQELHQLQPHRLFHNENFTCMLHKAILDEVNDIDKQDLLHVLLTKAIHCSVIKEYKIAVNLLNYALAKIDGIAPVVRERIRNALHQELLVLDLKLDSSNGKNEELSSRVKSYIWQTGKRPDLQARVEKHTVAYLLNTKETAFLNSLLNEMEDTNTTDYRLLGALLTTSYTSITKPQGWRKPVRLLWDAVLRVFSSTIQQKRPQDGPGYQVRRDAATVNMSGFMSFVKKIKDTSCLGLLLSCLVRLHNMSKEGQENARELFSSYTHLWPTSITNRSSVNFDDIDLALAHLTQHAVQVDPLNAAWLHTAGDWYLDSHSYSAALKCYIEAGACSSFNFNNPVPPTVWDDQVYKNMVSCCMNLKTHIQAALLCQCTDPVDYTTAFKAFQQAATASEDAMDQYYTLFWDITMLEYLIHTHSKRGQHEKKLLAMQAISQVDLNIYNSPDILQHAEQTRKAALFRSLAKQYL